MFRNAVIKVNDLNLARNPHLIPLPEWFVTATQWSWWLMLFNQFLIYTLDLALYKYKAKTNNVHLTKNMTMVKQNKVLFVSNSLHLFVLLATCLETVSALYRSIPVPTDAGEFTLTGKIFCVNKVIHSKHYTFC